MSSFFIRGFTNWVVSNLVFVQGISTFCTKVLNVIPKNRSLGRHCLFMFLIFLVAFTYETSNFSVAILETPLGRATMILIELVRFFHWTSTLHTLRGKKKGVRANKLQKIRSGGGFFGSKSLMGIFGVHIPSSVMLLNVILSLH